MKRLILLCAALCITLSFYSQTTPIEVASNTLKVPAFGEETFYYGFAEGDKVIFNFEEVKGKELKEIEIIEMPGSSKFMDYKSSKVDKSIDITRTGMYKFRFANSAISGRVCKFSIQRVPASEETKNFNCSVYWKTVYDTVARTVQEPYLVKKEYEPVTLVAPSKFYINSGSNATFKGGKSRISIPVQLPKNTVEWYYSFSADRDVEAVQHTAKSFNLLGQLTKIVDPSKSASIAVSLLTQPPGGNVCDVYLLDPANRSLFEEKVDYRYLPEGSRENIVSGIVRVKSSLYPHNYIGIKNPDNLHGIHVLVEAVAIILKEEWGVRDVVKYDVTNREVGYLK